MKKIDVDPLAVTDILPFIPNEFRAIFEENIPLEEQITAVYLLAIQKHLPDYEYKRLPPMPDGFSNDYEKYLMAVKDEQSGVWRRLINKYPGYIKAKDDAEAENWSNQFFLEEMMNYFRALGMSPQDEACRMALLTHKNISDPSR